jgi:hypothetical protein
MAALIFQASLEENLPELVPPRNLEQMLYDGPIMEDEVIIPTPETLLEALEARGAEVKRYKMLLTLARNTPHATGQEISTQFYRLRAAFLPGWTENPATVVAPYDYSPFLQYAEMGGLAGILNRFRSHSASQQYASSPLSTPKYISVFKRADDTGTTSNESAVRTF